MLTATTTEQRDIATSRLNRYITEGQARAVAVHQKIMNDVPTDYVAPSTKISFAESPKGIEMRVAGSETESRFAVHRHALGQLAEQCKMRIDYADHLLSQGTWGQDLLARNLTDGLQLGHGGAKYLVRTSGGEARAVLSNKFRRLDVRPIADALIGEAQKAGAIVVDGIASDIRVSMKFIIPRIFEPSPGEFMVYGFEYSNSDYGAGANALRAFANRLACFNGMTLEQNLRQVHLGRALSEDMEWSQRTLELDTRMAVSAARDTARMLLSPVKVEATNAIITKANAEGIEPKLVLANLKKKIGKGESDAIAAAFNSPDVVELPAGNTMWRFSNAISLVARDATDADRKLDLERLAGDVLKAA